MSMVTGPELREGYFPHWKLKTKGVIMPEERLPWDQTIVSGLQHGVAMAGGTIIGPLIMGFDPNLALLFSGVGTLIFFVIVAGRVPSYLGSSFSFIAVVIAATGYSGHGPNPNIVCSYSLDPRSRHRWLVNRAVRLDRRDGRPDLGRE
jgi:hypothetical protein